MFNLRIGLPNETEEHQSEKPHSDLDQVPWQFRRRSSDADTVNGRFAEEVDGYLRHTPEDPARNHARPAFPPGEPADQQAGASMRHQGERRKGAKPKDQVGKGRSNPGRHASDSGPECGGDEGFGDHSKVPVASGSCDREPDGRDHYRYQRDAYCSERYASGAQINFLLTAMQIDCTAGTLGSISTPSATSGLTPKVRESPAW